MESEILLRAFAFFKRCSFRVIAWESRFRRIWWNLTIKVKKAEKKKWVLVIQRWPFNKISEERRIKGEWCLKLLDSVAELLLVVSGFFWEGLWTSLSSAMHLVVKIIQWFSNQQLAVHTLGLVQARFLCCSQPFWKKVGV